MDKADYPNIEAKRALKPPKIIIYDIETSLALMATFGLRADYIPHENIIKDWNIICACWKEYGKKTVKSVSVLDFPKRFKKDPSDDYEVVKAIRDVLADADMVIHHNGDRFDVKKINARLIYHGLEPMPKLVSLDTLKEIKRVAAFTSNRLDYLSKHLGSTGKISTSKGLWLRVLAGDEKAIKEMVKYNKGDVDELEFVYNRVKPYIRHPNINHTTDNLCPRCGSNHINARGVRQMASGVWYRRFKCMNCGGWTKSRKAEKHKPPLVME